MASYSQLYALADQGGDLFQRIAVACVIQANVIRTETPPANSAQRLGLGTQEHCRTRRAPQSRCCGPPSRRMPR
jgi:hypothetical protein